MKRRADSDAETIQKRKQQRQPQVSCDSCRKKKLKCDRGDPCSSCVMRGLPCTGQAGPQRPVVQSRPPTMPVPAPVPGASNDDSILGRLRRLEHAVFGAGPAPTGASAGQVLAAESACGVDDRVHRRQRAVDEDPPRRARQRSLERSIINSERQQTAKFLDSTFTRHGLSVSLPHERMGFRIANVTQFPKTPSATTPGLTPADDPDGRPATWLMTQEEALKLLQDFINNPFHLLPIIHAPATRLMIDAFYSSLSRGEDPNLAYAALILGIAATSAFFFNENSEAFSTFPTSEEATQTALGWFRSGLSILEQSQPITYGCLEEVQARAILAYLVYNFEGCSARFRFLHGCSLSAAREIRLHLIDSPGADQQDDATTREIKRRLWWHIVSTDWMLGLMGGPTDGTYNVHPKQMNVKFPRNINDDDASLADDSVDFPPETATTMTCFLRRTQLSEICRSVIDARIPGIPDVEIMDYDQVLELDRLFEDALTEFPPFLHLNGPIPPGAPRFLALQRDVILVAFHSRRARLHRPFLLHETQDAMYQTSRDVCLRSARTVLSIGIRLLKSSQAVEPRRVYNPRAMGRRMGCVIGHLFMACTILALNAGLDTGRGPQEAGAGRSGGLAEATAETHAEVAEACRALASVGKESAVAARLVRSLVGVLRRYRVQGVDDVVASESENVPESSASTTEDEVQGGPFAPNKDQIQYDVDYPSMVNDNSLGLDGLWSDMWADPSTTYGWDQLFAGIDSYCGTT